MYIYTYEFHGGQPTNRGYEREMMGLLSSLVLFLPYWGWPLWVETRKVGIEPCCIILWKLAGGFFMLQASICGRISAELSTWCLELAQNLLGHRGWVHPKSEKSFFLWDLDRKLSFFCSCSLSFFFAMVKHLKNSPEDASLRSGEWKDLLRSWWDLTWVEESGPN